MFAALRRGIATRAWLLSWLDSGRSKFPCNREIGVRLVGAKGAGLDASREDISQGGIALRDSFQYRLDRLGDALSGSLRSGRCTAITSTQSYGAREFARQYIDLLFGLLRAFGISQLLGF